MKKLFCYFAIVCLLSIFCFGCDKNNINDPSVSTEEVEYNSSLETIENNLKDYNEFLGNFKAKITELNNAGTIGYDILELNTVESDDVVYHSFVINDNFEPIEIDDEYYSGTYDYEEKYFLRIDCDLENRITLVSIVGDQDDNLKLSLLALYVYEAMGYSVTNADDFYDKYNFWSDEEIFESYNEGNYTGICLTVNDDIEFNLLAE